MNMSFRTSDLWILALVALVLLILDRVYRINPFIERFQNPNPLACGVDMQPCAFGKRCMNGFCVSENIPDLPKNGLPVYP